MIPHNEKSLCMIMMKVLNRNSGLLPDQYFQFALIIWYVAEIIPNL